MYSSEEMKTFLLTAKSAILGYWEYLDAAHLYCYLLHQFLQTSAYREQNTWSQLWYFLKSLSKMLSSGRVILVKKEINYFETILLVLHILYRSVGPSPILVAVSAKVLNRGRAFHRDWNSLKPSPYSTCRWLCRLSFLKSTPLGLYRHFVYRTQFDRFR